MEDLWKIHSLDWRLPDMADAAEYKRLQKRFHDEEIKSHMRDLLYNDLPEKDPT